MKILGFIECAFENEFRSTIFLTKTCFIYPNSHISHIVYPSKHFLVQQYFASTGLFLSVENFVHIIHDEPAMPEFSVITVRKVIII